MTDHFKEAVLIGAGSRGWSIIEYQELFNSANEYFGKNNVVKLSIKYPRLHTLLLLAEFLKKPYRFYIFSPRTPPQDFISILIDSFITSILCRLFSVQCICMLSDAPVLKWRYSAVLSTMWGGKILTLMDNSITNTVLPGVRTYGPYLLPYSLATSRSVSRLMVDSQRSHSVFFSGWTYPDRKNMFDHVSSVLRDNNVPYSFSSRSLAGNRNSNTDYWQELCSSTILFTTSSQIKTKYSNGLDDHPHFIYRYFEALLAGNLLICHYCKGIERYFMPNIHFLVYSSFQEASSITLSAYRDFDDFLKVANEGHKRAHELVARYPFWADLANSSMLDY